MHTVRVILVATFPVLPRHRRVVPELVEPRADEGVAALHLVVEEAKREGAVHRLDPERQAAELHRERVEVHGVDAALHHVAAEHRLEAGLEAFVVRWAGDQLVAEAGLGNGVRGFVSSLPGVRRSCSSIAGSAAPEAEQPHEGALAVGLDAAVMLERGVERVGQNAERGEGEGPRPAGGIAYGEAESASPWPRIRISTASRTRSPSTSESSASPLRVSRIA